MKKICKYCKVEFKPKDRRNIYCGIQCSSASRKVKKVSVKCTHCGKVSKKFPSQVSKVPYCSQKCYRNYVEENHSVTTRCDMCGKVIRRSKSHYSNAKYNYCSYECADKGFSKFYSGSNNPNFLNTYTNCSYCGKEIYRKQSEFERSENFFCSVKCHGKWNSIHKVGESHPNYDNTLTTDERKARRSIDGYWAFRKSVYERDSFTCQVCGYDKGGTLNAHHLNSFHWDKKNRLNVDNAVTLCDACHKDFHSIYGNRNNTEEQFNQYRKDKTL